MKIQNRIQPCSVRVAEGILAVFLLFPLSAHADLKAGAQRFEINLGVAEPLTNLNASNIGGGTEQIGSTGFFGGFQYLYQNYPTFAVGLEGNAIHAGTEHSTSLFPNTDSSLQFDSGVLLGILRADLVAQGDVHPYLLGGFGMHYTHVNANVADLGTIADDTEATYAAALGIGVDFDVRQSFFVGIEGRYQYLGSASYGPAIEGPIATFSFLTHLGWKFGPSEPLRRPVPVTRPLQSTDKIVPASQTPPPPVATAPPASAPEPVVPVYKEEPSDTGKPPF